MRSPVTESQECRHGSTQKFRQVDPDNDFFCQYKRISQRAVRTSLEKLLDEPPSRGSICFSREVRPIASRGRPVLLLLRRKL